MTNMTFTKGVGTTTYMAPEILNREKYKKPADVFSFAVTMYEIMSWGICYPGKQFKFPWKIAEFVMSGQRMPKPDELSPDQFRIIEESWCHEPKDRLEIGDLQALIETEMIKLKQTE